MTLDLSSRQVLNNITSGKVVTIAFFDKAAYDSARIALIKALKKLGMQFDSLGVANPYEGKYVKARFDSKEVTGTFSLEDEQRKTNIKGRIYSVVKVEEL